MIHALPTAPEEQTLNYFKRKTAARLKIKEEKTFQRELFTGHDSGASEVPLQPGSRLHNEVLFPPPASHKGLHARWRPSPVALLLLSLHRCQHRLLFVTSQSRSDFSPWPFSAEARTSPDGGKDIGSSQEAGEDGGSCHLAKPSGALYTSDLHVSTCSKYNPPAFVDEPRALPLPEGETGERRA